MTLRHLPFLLAFALVSACDAPRPPIAFQTDVSRPPPPRPMRIERIGDDVREGAPLALAILAGRTVAFVADEDESAVHTLDVERGAEIARTDLPGTPTSLLVTADGRLAVALRRAAKVVLLAGPIDGPAGSLSLDRTLATADEPLALATTPDGASLLVASGIGRTLERFSLVDGTRSLAVSLGREPRAITVLSDGTRAAVSYAAESAVGLVELAKPSVRHVSLTIGSRRVLSFPSKKFMPAFEEDLFGSKVPPPKRLASFTAPRFARQGYALLRRSDAHGHEQILAPHALVTAGEPSLASDGYGAADAHAPVSFAVATITETGAPRRVELDDGCRLPRGAAHDPASSTLWVACQGEGAVVGYDVSSFLATKVRLPVSGGPSSVAVDGRSGSLVAWAPFDRAVHVFRSSSGPKSMEPVAAIALSHREGAGLSADAAAGRRLFHDAREKAISGDGRACASCHPDGRDDGLTWPTPEGPRQTIFLAGRVARSGPFGWSAKHESLPAHVKVTMKNLGGTGLHEPRLAQLAAWLRAMPAPPRTEPALDPVQAQGKAIFESKEAGCAGCHAVQPIPTTGADAYEVASATPADRTDAFLAPSLGSLGATAPYFHDGRYATLGELLRACDGKMGATGHLGTSQLAALEAYLDAL